MNQTLSKLEIISIAAALAFLALQGTAHSSQDAARPPAQAQQTPQGKQQAALPSSLEKEWKSAKDDYRERFKHAIGEMDRKIQALEEQTDGGSTEQRKAINEDIHDLRRNRERLQQQYDELRATSAIRLGNLKNRADQAFEDMRD